MRERVPSNIEESTATSVITREDVVLHSDSTLDDSLKKIPGLQVNVHRKGNVRASFRGFDQNRVAIIIDGIPVNDIHSTDIDISEISVAEIDEIIVSRGTTSALLGTAGGVGMIAIRTRKPDRLYGEARTRYGQYGNFSLNASTGAPMGKGFIRVAGEYDRSNGYEVSGRLDAKTRREWFDKFVRYDLYGLKFEELNMPAVKGYLDSGDRWEHTEYEKYGFSMKSGYAFSAKHEAGVNAYYNYKEALTNSYQNNCISDYKYTSGTWTDPVFDVTADPFNIKKAAFRNRSFVWPAIHNVGVSPYMDFDFGGARFRGNLYLSYKKAEQEKYASTDHTWPGDTVLADTALEPFRTIREYASFGGNLYPSVRLTRANTLNFALLYKYDIYNEAEQALSAEESPAIAATLFGLEPYDVKRLTAWSLTAAVEHETRFDRLSFTIGVSYDANALLSFKNREALYQYEDAYIVERNPDLIGSRDSVNPVAGFTYYAVRNLLLVRGAASKKTRFPNLNEYSLIVDDKRDNELKPERSYNFNGGFEFFNSHRSLSARCDYFYSSVKDRIEKITGGIDPPVNIGKVVSQGTEMILSYQSKRIGDTVDIHAEVSYTYIHMRNHDDTPEEKVNKGRLMEYIPVHQAGIDVRAKFVQGTTVALWGYATRNQIAYAMRSRPDPYPASTPFSTKYFEPVRLHDPVMLNVKIAQKILDHYEVYLMCRNLLDDYNADPFIPGPGRIFYAGGSVEF